ncbi:MAG: hypothetical protein ACI8RZ_001840 [Myxococcota bacterium]|jgi:uncharacterized protein YjbI with pentapeptide repeats
MNKIPLITARMNLATLLRSGDAGQIQQAVELLRSMPVQTRREVMDRFVLKGARLTAADLRGLILDGVVLWRASMPDAQMEGIRLRGADMRGTDLENADLRGADLTDADLRGSMLRGVRLDAAILTRADLRGAMLTRASLRGADLSEADLGGTDMREASLDHAVLRGAIWNEDTRWPEGMSPPDVPR